MIPVPTLLDPFLIGLALPLLLPALLLLLQVAAACLPGPAPLPARGVRPRLAVLVPAHNEAAGIVATLDDLKTQLRPDDRLLVVADNCTDATAALAAGAGAEVLERHDVRRRGKGFALDAGIRHLGREHPPEVLVIVDADCRLAPGSLDALGRQCRASGRPVQAVDLMYAPPGAGAAVELAAFAWLLKNLVRPLGYARLGLPCQLMGTGMALPWPALTQARLASDHLAEDVELGLSLAAAGRPPLLCREALVSSFFPFAASGRQQQRQRWEHGHLDLIVHRAGKLLGIAVANGDVGLLALVLDLCIPPLALLQLLAAALLAVCLAAFGLGVAGAAPAAVAAFACLLVALSVLLAWAVFARPQLPLASLALAPLYALAKLPVYLAFFTGKQAEWIRSKREDES